MSLESFIMKFSEQFDDTSSDVFTENLEFRNLEEWSSMVALSVIAMVDESYNVRLTGEDIKSSKTIIDIYNIVQAKSN